MTTRPSAELRRQVLERADNRCEYCLIHQDDAVASHQIDHVIAEKHGGPTTTENLALSCITCNLRKASDLSSIDPDSGDIVPLFNPRTQAWSDHFRVDGVTIIGLTSEGRTTVEFLQLNSYERTSERRELMWTARFPPPQ
ncbi:MAG: HNH endonuclease [Planctomycetaceae bacterium]